MRMTKLTTRLGAGLLVAAALAGCSGMMEARPVCTTSHDGGGNRLTPMAQCEVGGGRIANPGRNR
ncbi:MAG: hypothetical protein AAFU49_07245 [Pseudomonadota bacterium]